MIDLENTNFVLSNAISAEWEHRCDVFHKNKWIRIADFGTVLVGVDSEDPFVIDCAALNRPGMRFIAPKSWGMAHLLKSLGAFPSVGEAKRNGWDKPIEFGFGPTVLRLDKIVGAIWVWKG